MRIYQELNTRQINRDLDSKLNKAGCSILGSFNSMQTTKGIGHSRQLTIHKRIETNNGTKIDLKFDPLPDTATSRKGYRFVPYNPEDKKHKELPKYVRVPATDYTGQYKTEYDVYINDRRVSTINNQTDMNNFISKLDNILNKVV